MAASEKRAQVSYSPFVGRGAVGGKAEQAVVRGKRRDGRSPEECRPVFIKIGTVSQASGSAYVELGTTKAMVSVFGPREGRGGWEGPSSSMGSLTVNVSFAPFARPTRKERSMVGAPDAEQDAAAQAMHRALTPAIRFDTFPKATVDVMGLVLEAGGAELSALILCASVALADAAIHLNDLVACATLSICQDHMLLDPSAAEEQVAEGEVTVALMPTADELTLLSFCGDLQPPQLMEAQELCIGGCLKLDEIMRAALREELQANMDS